MENRQAYERLARGLGQQATENPVVAAVLDHVRWRALDPEDGLCLLVRILESELRQERYARLQREQAQPLKPMVVGRYAFTPPGWGGPKEVAPAPAGVCDECGGSGLDPICNAPGMPLPVGAKWPCPKCSPQYDVPPRAARHPGEDAAGGPGESDGGR